MEHTFTTTGDTVYTCTFKDGVFTESITDADGHTSSVVMTDPSDILTFFIEFAVNSIELVLDEDVAAHNTTGLLGIMDFHSQVADILFPIESILANNTFGTVNRRAQA